MENLESHLNRIIAKHAKDAAAQIKESVHEAIKKKSA